MRLTYLYHSGFWLETDSCHIVMDFFRDGYDCKPEERRKGGVARAIGSIGTDSLVCCDEMENLEGLKVSPADCKSPGVLGRMLLNPGKPLYIMCTHFHKDHFLPFVMKIYEYALQRRAEDASYPEVRLVFSRDIRRSRKKSCGVHIDAINFIAKGETYEDELLKVDAYGSTDVGSSFGITVKDNGFHFFHAGDFNYWHWQEESSEKEVQEAHEFFRSELDFIAQRVTGFDAILFPVDPRMQTNISAGAQEFFNSIPYQLLVPVHVIEKPDFTCSDLQNNELFATWEMQRGPCNEDCARPLMLAGAQDAKGLIRRIWLPENAGDSCCIDLQS